MNDERDRTIRKAYSMAMTQLRANHHEEFLKLQSEAAKELGVDWSPQPTAEEKAESEVARLFEEFPDLRDKFGL